MSTASVEMFGVWIRPPLVVCLDDRIDMPVQAPRLAVEQT